MDFYDRLSKLMKEQKKTRRELSKETGISYGTLTAMFTRRSLGVDIRTMKKIATSLNTTLEYLTTGNEEYLYLSPAEKNFSIVAIRNEDDKRFFSFSEDEFEAILIILEKFKKGGK